MPWPVHPTGFFGAQGGDNDTYKIERSLRFNSADSAYLDRTPASAGNLTTWTWSGWFKRSKLGASQTLFSSGTSAVTLIHIQADDTLRLRNSTLEYVTTQVFRDVSAWYHLVVRWETGNATAGDRVRVYINGSEINSFSTETHAGSNEQSEWNKAQANQIGRYAFNGTLYFDGYLTEIHFIDGQALTPSSFGETDAITGRWKAKAYSGTYGTNGFYLKFADNSGTTATTLGKDSSGNGNNWTPNNFSVTAGAGNDSLLDSPTNNGTSGNYCTLNPLENTGLTLLNGNLDSYYAPTNYASAKSTISMTSGKWYFETTVSQVSSYMMVGVFKTSETLPSLGVNGYISYSQYGWSYETIGDIRNNNVSTTSGISSSTTNDIINIAIDIDAGKIWFGKNGVFFNSGSPATGVNPAYSNLSGAMSPAISIYNSSSSVGLAINFGQRPFAYTAPTGFKALCTTNLPTPTIRKPSSYMDVVTYTGNGSARSITGLGFSPDLVWIKGRSGATDHAIYDSVRGVQLDLASNLTSAETTQSQGLTAFNSDGFSIGTLAKINTNTSTYVAWAWDRAAIDGLDIVSYTGTSVARTISHNLGVAPKMMIISGRSGTSIGGWPVYHSSLTSASYSLMLNETSPQSNTSPYFNNTAPTSSVFSVSGSPSTNWGVVNYLNSTYIAYLFAEVEGFSKFGSYTGNGSSDGPFVWCGFRPRWVMIKNITTGGTNYDWVIADSVRETFNVTANNLAANTSASEASGILSQPNDFISNGFKLRASGGNAYPTNASGNTYIFAAFAESPFKYARAR